MSRSLTSRERRTITVGAILVVPALLFLGVVRPYRAALTEATDRLATERDALSRERGAVLAARAHPELQHITDSVLQLVQPRLFAGDDDVIASAELASYVGDLARRHHVWLQDASTRTASPLVAGVRALHVDIRAESDVQGVLEFLDALERGDKAVRVERLDLSRALGTPGNENAETVVLAATVSGYALGGTASTTTPTARPSSMP
ncbi:MAG TPA: type II secretion system protein GspM [Gemmatimonadales bacterium]|jgi:hypothetical protein